MSIYNLKTKYKKTISDDATKLLSIGHIKWKDNRFNRVMHMHEDQIEILLVAHGTGTHLIDGVRYQVTDGDIIVHDAGVMHEEDRSDDLRTDIRYIAAHVDQNNIHLGSTSANRLVPNGVSPVICSARHFHSIYYMMQEMYDNIDKTIVQMSEDDAIHMHITEMNHYMLKAIIMMVMELYTEAEPKRSSDEDVLGHRIRMYLDEHFLEEIVIQDIADSLNINKFYLSHIFKKMTGISPMAYATRHRIGDAQGLLLETDMNVAEIAYKVGFNSTNHFSKMFTKFTGTTPGHFRKFRQENM
ncbi:MAG: AraC family transcriptional regulator [Clostridiales Family XIII bacterium]|jgi:AraC-like DNA-binding protein|nr:AraC family transcriptional regulator [Clostridiales Family XIII bacterium]